MEGKNGHGGCRPGAGRPQKNNTKSITVRLTPEHHEYISTKRNITEYINGLIKSDIEQER